MARSAAHPHVVPDMTIPEVRPPERRNEGGWVRSQRRIWHEDSMLSDFQEIAAWAYLYHKAEPTPRPRPLCGHEIFVNQYELVTSMAFLASYWGWHRERVRRFLARLMVARRITVSVIFPDRSERAIGERSASDSRAIGIRIKILNGKAYSSSGNHAAGNGNPDTSDEQGTLRQETQNKGQESPGIAPESDASSPTSESCQPGADAPDRPPDWFDELEPQPTEPANQQQSESPKPKPYAFNGRIIRLTKRDFDAWQENYGFPTPQALRAKLAALDAFYDQELTGKDRHRWFIRCAAALAKQQQEITEKATAKEPAWDGIL